MVVFVLPPSGELRCIEIELRNTGPVGAANIHLVSRTAGLLSFGKKTTGPTAGLFEFPLVERSQPPLRLVQEDGTVSQVEHQAVLRSRQPFGSTVCLSAHMSIFFLFPCLSFFVCPAVFLYIVSPSLPAHFSLLFVVLVYLPKSLFSVLVCQS